MTYTKIPSFASDYPEIAETLEQARLPFYCINCYRKRETAYLTPNFGPFCEECLKQIPDKIEFALKALKNYGADVECGACMEIAFTGVTTNEHSCEQDVTPTKVYVAAHDIEEGTLVKVVKSICYIDHATGESDHMNAHIRTSRCEL